jgi:hypothetical protein
MAAPENRADFEEWRDKELQNARLGVVGNVFDFIDHPELQAAYPDLFRMPFKQLSPDHPEWVGSSNSWGYYDPANKAVVINSTIPESKQRTTALHELQHAIQDIEGWQGGSSPAFMAARLAEREIAKTREADLLQSIQDMQKILPPSANNLILTEGQKLKNIQDFLNETKDLEGMTNPYRAYEKAAGEEEARMVERRSKYPEDQLKFYSPHGDFDSDIKTHITDFASGGEVHMAGGGFLDMMAKAAKQGVTRAQRLAMSNKDVARRIPALEEAIAALERGEITKQQYAQLVQAYKPVAPYETFFNPEPDEKIIGALTKTNREKEGTRPKQSYFGVPSSTLKRGDKAATRQDIPSYTEADTWVVTAHQPQQGKRVYAGAGPRIGYEPVAMLNDVRFEVQPNAAMKIAKGGQKGTIATMEGYWEPITRELAEEMGPELMRDPRWVQAGMDPTRSASFYNRETMQPILEGEQVLHSGPLVLVKNPRYGDIEDFPFKEGGEVHAAKGGILGALAKTAEAGIERAAKTAKAMQQVLPAAEREANLAKFLEPSAVQMRLYHGTPATEGGKGKEAIRRIKPSKEGALGSGSYLTPDPRYASGYANEGDANVLPVYAQLKNPLKIEGIHGDPMIEALVKLGMDEDQAARMVEKAYDGPGYIGKQVQNRAQAAGYDGLVQYRDGSPSEVVVYNPNAIKSAIGNQGTYDIYNPELSKAAGGAVMMSKGGVLSALAKTAEKGMEKAVKPAKADIPPMGINVRTDSKLNIPFADLIVDGQKVYESRKSDSLRPYVNKSISIVRTGKGPAKAIGSVEIGEPMIVDAKKFREMQDKHLVPEGSMFDIEAEGQKYLYPLSNSRRFDQELDVGHGIKARKVILPDDMDKKKGGRVTIDEFLKRMKEK